MALHRVFTAVLLALALAGCGGPEPAVPAQPMRSSANTTTIVGGATLQASTLDVADLNDTVARRYDIDRGHPGVMLLVTVRDAQGNRIAPGDLRMDAIAGALPDAPTPLPLHPITIDGMTDYIGIFNVSPPATVQFRITAIRDGARVEFTTTAELYPR